MASSLYLFVVDPVLFSENGDNKIEEQCIKFVFEIYHYYESFYWTAVVYIRRSSSRAYVYFSGLKRSSWLDAATGIYTSF